MMDRIPLSSLRTPQIPMGVLTDSELLLGGIMQGKRVLHSRLLPLETSGWSDLVEYLWQQGVSSVWVMPASQRSQHATCASLTEVSNHWISLMRPSPAHPDRPGSVLCWPRGQQGGGGRRLTLTFPEYMGWPWELADAMSLLATVIYLDQVLARHVVDAPEVCAQQLLNELTMEQASTSLRSSSVDLLSLSDRQGIPIPLLEGAEGFAWLRPLTLVEQRQRYLHKYIHISRTLEACLDVSLGAGTPELSSSGRAFDGARPGIWRVQLERAGSLFDGKTLPGCLNQEWMSTPQVVCCRNIGYAVEVKEGWYWPQSHQMLKRWASTLWQAALHLHTQPHHYRHTQARANASRTITQLAELGIELLSRPEKEGGWSRPDWRAQVIGRAWALRFAHLARLVKQGAMPVLMCGDSFWVVSHDPGPLTAIPGLRGSRHWSGLMPGYEVPLPLSTEVRDTLRGGVAIDQIVHKLDSLAKDIFP